MPSVANAREPYLSESQPDTGSLTMNPISIGMVQMPAPQRRLFRRSRPMEARCLEAR